MEKLTDLQVQAALIFLGYDPGPLDGICGQNTRKALSSFAEDYGLSGQSSDAQRSSLVGAIGKTIQKKTTSTSSATPSAAQQPVVTDPADPFYGIKYFREAEFRCKCGGKYCKGDTAKMDRKLLEIDDKIRAHFNAPASITSGIRCKQHNANVGGVANSRHMTGHANDMVVDKVSAQQLLAYVKTLSGVNYAYAIDGSAVHIDTI